MQTILHILDCKVEASQKYAYYLAKEKISQNYRIKYCSEVGLAHCAKLHERTEVFFEKLRICLCKNVFKSRLVSRVRQFFNGEFVNNFFFFSKSLQLTPIINLLC